MKDELHFIERENIAKNLDLNETIREYSQEIDFLTQVAKQFFRDDELNKIRDKSEFDYNLNKWIVPRLNKRESSLPKIKGAAE